MKTFFSFLLTLLLLGCNEKSENQQESKTVEKKFIGSIEKLDDELSQLLDGNVRPEIIGEGFEWSEGPVWVEMHQFLLFSDIPANTIYRWEEGEGVKELLIPAGYTGSEERGGEMGSNGLMIDKENRLVMCQHGDRRIARMHSSLTQPAADFVTLVDSYQGKKLNSPNDLVMHSNGDIYFTDPPYGLEGGMEDPGKELTFQGVYRLDPEGNVKLLTDELSRPNGLAFSPDERVLYIANSDPQNPVWMEYEVTQEGNLTNGRIFYDASEFVGVEKGLPDGLKVDSDGYIYGTGPGGVWIFAPDGRVLGKIKTGQATSNCAIGNDGSMLYITADMYLLRIPLK